jgi:hypothetical protein
LSDITCTVCGTELDLAALLAHVDDQKALTRLVAISVPMGARVLQYISLFKPEKQSLTAAKKIKLILQLLPDLERKAITHKGRDWDAPLIAWAQAIDRMIFYRDIGKLDLPMRGHIYLYSIIADLANSSEAAQERQLEQDRRTGPRPATTNGLTNLADLAAAAPVAPVAPRSFPQSSPGMSPTVRAMREQLAANAAGRKETKPC